MLSGTTNVVLGGSEPSGEPSVCTSVGHLSRGKSCRARASCEEGFGFNSLPYLATQQIKFTIITITSKGDTFSDIYKISKFHNSQLYKIVVGYYRPLTLYITL